MRVPPFFFFFFFNDTATTEIYTLSLHDALPIFLHDFIRAGIDALHPAVGPHASDRILRHVAVSAVQRSEEHTSELQSQSNLVCRLLLEKKKKLLRPATVLHRQLSAPRTLHHC